MLSGLKRLFFKTILRKIIMGIILILILMLLATLVLLYFAIKAEPKQENQSDASDVSDAKAMLFGFSAIMALVTIITWFSASYTEVPTGHGGVVKTFGKVELEDTTLTEGLNWIKPWQNVDHMSHQQISFDRNGHQGNAAIVQAKDKIPMEADVSFHSILNYSAMSHIRQHYGVNYWDGLLVQSAASALRTAASEYEAWDDLQVDKRIDFQNRITALYKTTVISKMKSKGIPEAIVSSAFDFPTVDLRRVVPVDKELTEQIALSKAAEQKTSRKTTEIINAALDAQKRGQDGTAIRDTILRVLYKADSEGKLSDDVDLPKDTSLSEISQFILAIAEVKRADAVEIAAEKGNLTVMVTGGGNTALPLQK